MTFESMCPLADHLWQSTLFAALAGLLTLALRNNRARVRHAIWLVAFCKFLIPASLLIALGGQFVWRTAPSIVPLYTVASEIGQPFSGSPKGEPALPPAPTAPSADAFITVLILAAWACGLIVIAGLWFARWQRIRAIVRAGSPTDLQLPIPAISSQALMEPGIFGIGRPILLLPEGILDRLSPEQVNAVIAHELCHVRHRDNLVAAIQMSVETLLWFHPMVWWIGKRMIAERERACDEEVLELGIQPRDYAEGILRVCRLYAESPLACVAGVTGSDLKKRIHGIVSGKVGHDLTLIKKAALLTAGAACLALPILIGVTNAPPMRGQTQASIPLMPPSGVKFRSASIERCTAYGQGEIESPAPGRLVANCVTSVHLIQIAWLKNSDPGDDPPVQLSWDPAWLGSGNYLYRIDAHADRSANIASMEGPMLQALLEDRYHLKLHRETRNVAAFALTVAKSGPRLRPSDAASCDGKWPGNAPLPWTGNAPPPWPGVFVRSNCVSFAGRLGEGGVLEGQALSLQDFARLLSQPLQKGVIDQTGIAGKFDFHLAFATDLTPGLLSQLYSSLPDVVEKQLGLKLERTVLPRQFLVIDHAEKPIPD